MKQSNHFLLGVIALLVSLHPFPAGADIAIRISIKRILSSSGQPPTGGPNVNALNTLAKITNQVTLANSILDAHGRGYRFVITDLVDISALSAYFTAPARSSQTKDSLENDARNNPSGSMWRNDALNVFVNNDTNSAVCSPPGDGTIILMGQGVLATTLLHESGHFFHLWHTQGRFCGGCGEPPFDGAPILQNLCSTVPDDDLVADTLLDLQCWTQQDIAQNNLMRSFGSLNPDETRLVNNVFFNVMSYHANRSILTSDQLDRWTDAANNSRSFAVSARTIFVDRNSPCVVPGDLVEPFRTLANAVTGWSLGTSGGLGVTLDPRNPPGGLPPAPCPPQPLPCSMTVCLGGPYKSLGDGLGAAPGGSLVLIRAGNYNEPRRINQSVSLRASRGNVAIGKP